MGNIHGGIYRMSGTGNYPYYDIRFDEKTHDPIPQERTSFEQSRHGQSQSQSQRSGLDQNRSKTFFQSLPSEQSGQNDSRYMESLTRGRSNGQYGANDNRARYESDPELRHLSDYGGVGRNRGLTFEETYNPSSGHNIGRNRNSLPINDPGAHDVNHPVYSDGRPKSYVQAMKELEDQERHDAEEEYRKSRKKSSKHHHGPRPHGLLGGSTDQDPSTEGKRKSTNSDRRKSIYFADEQNSNPNSRYKNPRQSLYEEFGCKGVNELPAGYKSLCADCMWKKADFFSRMDKISLSSGGYFVSTSGRCADVNLSPGCLEGVPCTKWTAERDILDAVTCACGTNRRSYIPTREPLTPCCPHLMERVRKMIIDWDEDYTGSGKEKPSNYWRLGDNSPSKSPEKRPSISDTKSQSSKSTMGTSIRNSPSTLVTTSFSPGSDYKENRYKPSKIKPQKTRSRLLPRIQSSTSSIRKPTRTTGNKHPDPEMKGKTQSKYPKVQPSRSVERPFQSKKMMPQSSGQRYEKSKYPQSTIPHEEIPQSSTKKPMEKSPKSHGKSVGNIPSDKSIPVQGYKRKPQDFSKSPKNGANFDYKPEKPSKSREKLPEIKSEDGQKLGKPTKDELTEHPEQNPRKRSEIKDFQEPIADKLPNESPEKLPEEIPSESGESSIPSSNTPTGYRPHPRTKPSHKSLGNRTIPRPGKATRSKSKVYFPSSTKIKVTGKKSLPYFSSKKSIKSIKSKPTSSKKIRPSFKEKFSKGPFKKQEASSDNESVVSSPNSSSTSFMRKLQKKSKSKPKVKTSSKKFQKLPKDVEDFPVNESRIEGRPENIDESTNKLDKSDKSTSRPERPQKRTKSPSKVSSNISSGGQMTPSESDEIEPTKLKDLEDDDKFAFKPQITVKSNPGPLRVPTPVVYQDQGQDEEKVTPKPQVFTPKRTNFPSVVVRSLRSRKSRKDSDSDDEFEKKRSSKSSRNRKIGQRKSTSKPSERKSKSKISKHQSFEVKPQLPIPTSSHERKKSSPNPSITSSKPFLPQETSNNARDLSPTRSSEVFGPKVESFKLISFEKPEINSLSFKRFSHRIAYDDLSDDSNHSLGTPPFISPSDGSISTIGSKGSEKSYTYRSSSTSTSEKSSRPSPHTKPSHKSLTNSARRPKSVKSKRFKDASTRTAGHKKVFSSKKPSFRSKFSSSDENTTSSVESDQESKPEKSQLGPKNRGKDKDRKPSKTSITRLGSADKQPPDVKILFSQGEKPEATPELPESLTEMEPVLKAHGKMKGKPPKDSESESDGSSSKESVISPSSDQISKPQNMEPSKRRTKDEKDHKPSTKYHENEEPRKTSKKSPSTSGKPRNGTEIPNPLNNNQKGDKSKKILSYSSEILKPSGSTKDQDKESEKFGSESEDSNSDFGKENEILQNPSNVTIAPPRTPRVNESNEIGKPQKTKENSPDSSRDSSLKQKTIKGAKEPINEGIPEPTKIGQIPHQVSNKTSQEMVQIPENQSHNRPSAEEQDSLEKPSKNSRNPSKYDPTYDEANLPDYQIKRPESIKLESPPDKSSPIISSKEIEPVSGVGDDISTSRKESPIDKESSIPSQKSGEISPSKRNLEKGTQSEEIPVRKAYPNSLSNVSTQTTDEKYTQTPLSRPVAKSRSKTPDGSLKLSSQRPPSRVSTPSSKYPRPNTQTKPGNKSISHRKGPATAVGIGADKVQPRPPKSKSKFSPSLNEFEKKYPLARGEFHRIPFNKKGQPVPTESGHSISSRNGLSSDRLYPTRNVSRPSIDASRPSTSGSGPKKFERESRSRTRPGTGTSTIRSSTPSTSTSKTIIPPGRGRISKPGENRRKISSISPAGESHRPTSQNELSPLNSNVRESRESGLSPIISDQDQNIPVSASQEQTPVSSEIFPDQKTPISGQITPSTGTGTKPKPKPQAKIIKPVVKTKNVHPIDEQPSATASPVTSSHGPIRPIHKPIPWIGSETSRPTSNTNSSTDQKTPQQHPQPNQACRERRRMMKSSSEFNNVASPQATTSYPAVLSLSYTNTTSQSGQCSPIQSQVSTNQNQNRTRQQQHQVSNDPNKKSTAVADKSNDPNKKNTDKCVLTSILSDSHGNAIPFDIETCIRKIHEKNKKTEETQELEIKLEQIGLSNRSSLLDQNISSTATSTTTNTNTNNSSQYLLSPNQEPDDQPDDNQINNEVDKIIKESLNFIENDEKK